MSQAVANAAGPEARPVYVRVALVGLLLFFGALGLGMTLTLVQGESIGSIAFYIVIMALSALFAGLAWLFRRWGALAAGIWGVVMLLLNTPFVIPSLVRLDSFFDFFLAQFVIVSLLLVTVGSIVAFVQYGKGQPRTSATRGERWAFGTLAVVMVGVAAISAAIHLADLETLSPEERAGAVSVEMRNTQFEPRLVQMGVGEPARIAVKNNDFFVHTFTVDELGIDETVNPGRELLITLPSSQAGTFTYRCDISGHERMTGTLELS